MPEPPQSPALAPGATPPPQRTSGHRKQRLIALMLLRNGAMGLLAWAGREAQPAAGR